MPDETTPTEEWIDGVYRAARAFARSRGTVAPVVRVTLYDGVRLRVAALAPGPLPDWVAIDPYPDDPEADMVPAGAGDEAGPQTPEQVLVPVRGVAKVELLADEPDRGVGFRIVDDAAS